MQKFKMADNEGENEEEVTAKQKKNRKKKEAAKRKKQAQKEKVYTEFVNGLFMQHIALNILFCVLSRPQKHLNCLMERGRRRLAKKWNQIMLDHLFKKSVK